MIRDSLAGHNLKWELVRVPGGDTRIPGVTGPVHVETFLIGRAEVPWELFDVFYLRLDVPRAERANIDAVSRPSRPYGAPDRGFGHRGFPVISITHQSAVQFAGWLSERTGQRYSLATEAQWQRAADLAFAGVPAAEYIKYAWSRSAAAGATRAIATLSPDRLGLFDLLGNAGEWVTGADGAPSLRGGSYLTGEDSLSPGLRDRQQHAWNQTDPQDPKSRWWLSDGPFAGLRLVRIP
ncbi:MAG: formylglycine-generating enzyme family protein [Gemmatimonadota bacterium]